MAPLSLGDSHNFGRRVEARGGRVRKPRTIVWEQLLLSSESGLRRCLDGKAKEDGLARDAFRFLPDLKFTPSREGHGGEVQRLSLAPLPKPSREGREALAKIVGRALALFTWLGLSDLHWENLALGASARGRVVFTPLDVEMILADLSSPTETKLLPAADPDVAEICRHACGVRRVLPYLGKPLDAKALLAIAGAYHATLLFLDRHAQEIAATLAQLPSLGQTPIRVLLRGTGDYVHARSMPIWPPLLDAESEQLARGDIPYFFRLYGRPGIHYFADPSLRTFATLPRRGDVPQPDPMLSIAKGLRAPSRRRLREEGLFALLGAFDHKEISGRHTLDGPEGLDVTFGARSLVVKLEGGDELETKRNLRAFVGSVYLPCTCGEVRTVFVPPVTRCGARGNPQP